MAQNCSHCSAPNADDAKFCAACGARLTAPAAGTPEDPWLERVLAGRYRILRCLGEGGMGRVYLAEQRMGSIVRPVAVKVMHPELNATPMMRERFERECGLVVQLSHPNTI